MRPSDWLHSIKGHYPGSVCFPKDELSNGDSRRFARLWLVEGIPFAFRDYPGCFVAARDVLASNLGVSFRDVSMTGSGRLGYSLNPSRFGAEYDATKSDLDLFVVSDRWFLLLCEQGNQFVDDFRMGEVRPRNDVEERCWPSNVSRIPKTMDMEFIDPKRVPTFDRYPTVQKVSNQTFIFRANVNEWAGVEAVNSCSIRVYRDWTAVINQIAFNVRSAIKYRDKLAKL